MGGTALAGYYAEHRRSDDLDLFAVDATAHKMAQLALRSLEQEGALFSNELSSPEYYHSDVEFRGHPFTVDIVLDVHLHQLGGAIQTHDNVWVVDLDTIFATKAACLVSRCSEKDLFDLAWMFERAKKTDMETLIEKGSAIDGGLSVETLLISLQGAQLRKEACHFLLADSNLTVDRVYKTIQNLRKKLIRLLLDYEKNQPPTPEVEALSQAMADQKRMMKKKDS